MNDMKLNIEVNLGWIDESCDLDEIVKTQITEEIVKKVSEKAIENFEKSASNKVKTVFDKIEKKIDELVTKEFNQILKKPVIETDSWGDKIKEYKTPKEMIKAKFDNWLLEKVDEYGKPSSYGKYNRMNYFIDAQLQKFSKEFTEKTVKEMHQKLTNTINDDMKELLGGKILEVINVKQLLQAASDNSLKEHN